MSSHTTPPSPTAANPSPRTPLRFSLFALLSVTTLAGCMSAIVFSDSWRPYERLLVVFWGAGLTVGMSVGRARGTQGIFSGTFGAVVGCLLAACVQRTDGWQRIEFDQPDSIYHLFVVGVGWVLALLATSLYSLLTNSSVQRLCAHYRSRRAAVVVAGCVIGAFVVLQFTLPRTWHHAWDVSSGVDELSGAAPRFHLTPDGSQLLVLPVQQYFTNQRIQSQFYRATSTGIVSRKLPLVSSDSNLVFSPDGKQMAVGRYNDFRLLDIETGMIFIRWVAPDDDESIVHMQFDADGKRILVTTHSLRIQRLYTIDLSGKPAPQVELFPFAGTLWIAPAGEMLVKMSAENDETGEMKTEVVRRSDEQVIYRLRDVTRQQSPTFSPDGKSIAFGNRLWQLSTNSVTHFAGDVIGLLPSGHAIIFQPDAKGRWDTAAPAWLRKMPFIRQSFAEHPMAQLSMVVIATGQVVAVSPRFNVLTRPQVSAQGNVVAATTREGRIRVWKVPPL